MDSVGRSPVQVSFIRKTHEREPHSTPSLHRQVTASFLGLICLLYLVEGRDAHDAAALAVGARHQRCGEAVLFLRTRINWIGLVASESIS